MAKSKKQLHEELRAKFLQQYVEFMREQGEEVLIVASNEICIPCVDSEDNDEYMLVRFKVPLGSKDEVYDGYEMAREYSAKCEEKAEKERIAKEKKERKIAKDKADREAKAKAKAENGNK
jgi:type III secretory pathway component EscV